MSISVEDVKHIAKLANLDFTNEQIQHLQKDLNQIINYFEKLNELDTTNVDPLSHTQKIVNVMRNDETEASLQINEVLRNAPDKSGNFFKVPKVIR